MRKWILIPLVLALLVTVCYAQSIRRAYDFPSSAAAVEPGEIADDSILVADIANGDWGDFTITSNVASLDPNVVAASELASGDYGDISISAAGVLTIDDDVVDADTLANGDYGDVSISGGVISLDSSVIALGDFAFGANEGDMLLYTGSAWTVLDVNDPDNILVINDSNTPSWVSYIPDLDDLIIDDGGEVGPGAGNGGGSGKIKFNSSSSQIYILDGDVGIGTETVAAGTQLTVSEPTNSADLYIQWQSDNGDDNADKWRWAIADGGTYVTLQYYGTGSWVDMDWLGLMGTDPDVDTRGQVAVDIDGANEPNDVILRTSDIGADTQYALAQAYKTITIPINNPDSITAWTGRANSGQPIWFNSTGMTFTIVEIYAVCDTDDYSFSLFESSSASDFSDENDTLIDAILCETDGTEGYTDTETTISHATIEHDHAIIFEHTSVDAGGLIISIRGYFDANVD